MTEAVSEDLMRSVVDAKDHGERKFNHLTNNFHVIKAAIRYFSVKRGMSFNSTKVSRKFPVAATVSGSALSVLEEIGTIQPRTDSNSSSRYMPRDVDMDQLEELEQILVENREIRSFKG